MRAAQLDAVRSVMDSGWYVLGQNVSSLKMNGLPAVRVLVALV